MICWTYCRIICADFVLSGTNMMGGHHMQTNGDVNGAHSSQSIVSTSHCTPPPPYNPDPSLVRYYTLQ